MITAGILAGQSESFKLHIRVRRLESFFRFVKAVETEIRFTAVPVTELLQRHIRELPFLSDCLEKVRKGEPFEQAWMTVVKTASGYSESDREILILFGTELGKTDLQGQLSHCGMTEGLLDTALEEARKERDTKSKIYQMLGTFGGVAAALLIG